MDTHAKDSNPMNSGTEATCENENIWDLVDPFDDYTPSDSLEQSSKHGNTKSQSSQNRISIPNHSFQNLAREPYEYDSLNEAKDEIRLLTIQPGHFNDPITCHLSTIPLSGVPLFEALSYTWGDPIVRNEIFVDGKSLDITRNLYMALRYLRFEKVPRVMWIDAICVNQLNLAERSEQVLHMAKIYSTARDVIVWLGESSEVTDQLFVLMDVILGVGDRALATARGPRGKLELDMLTPSARNLYKLQDGLWSFQETALKHLGQLALVYASGGNIGQRLFSAREHLTKTHQFNRLARMKNLTTSDVIPQHGYPTPMDLDGEIKYAVMDLFSRPWWSRMWVVQEFILAKDCTIMCGEHRLAWSEFHRFISWEYSEDHISTLRLGRSVASLGLDLHQLRTLTLSAHREGKILGSPPTEEAETVVHGPIRISDLMLQFEHYQASDPRDKIYALLDLAGDGESIVPNYNAPLETVYTSLVQVLVQKWKDFDIICKHHRGYNSLNLPSWVPDWTVKRALPHQWSGARGTNIQSIRAIQDSRQTYNASESLFAEAQINQPNRLNVRGIQHDVVKHVFELDREGPFDWPLRLLNKVVDARSFMFNIYMISTEYIVLAFWRTLLHDVGWKSSKRTSENDRKTISEEFFRHDFVPGKIPNEMVLYAGPCKEIIDHATRINDNYKFIVSRRGGIGLVPRTTKVGDLVCILMGAQVPFILRRRETPSTQFEMIGPAYVHGIMDGEAIRFAKRKGPLRVSQSWFDII
jgi:hypothetical protein